MKYMTYKLGNEGHGEYIIPETICFHGTEVEALRRAYREQTECLELPTGSATYQWRWIVQENAKSIPAWRQSSRD